MCTPTHTHTHTALSVKSIYLMAACEDAQHAVAEDHGRGVLLDAEKILHVLKSCCSGLCHILLRLWRGRESAGLASWREEASGRAGLKSRDRVQTSGADDYVLPGPLLSLQHFTSLTIYRLFCC